ncbi:MAG: DUF805 domain-containing protein [Acidithiobacillus sp.]|nr:DUF805 domain-containing protein [Acidithiobacillus sp.]
MRMIDAFTNAVFRNYAQFNGRTHRAEFWWYVLATVIISFILAFIGGFLVGFSATLSHGDMGSTWNYIFYAPFVLFMIALIIPNLAIEVRRLHDINLSGWWILLTLVPYIGSIVILILMLLPSKPEGERFGPYVDSSSG